MYQFIYYSKSLPASIVITAQNKREADKVLKEFGDDVFQEFIFEEKIKI